MTRFILLVTCLMLFSACAVTFPADYTPESYVKLGEEQVRMGAFAYVPADQGKLKTVRRQTLWNHLTLFLSDTFLPVTSPV